ncbi:MAG: hypothetical protein V4582_04700 [Pseudomonadota bacterium]
MGVRVPEGQAKFERLPENIRERCPNLGDTKEWHGHFWIFARAHDAAGTYFVLGGYDEYPKNAAAERFELGTEGMLVEIRGSSCADFGRGQDLFRDSDYPRMSPSILRQLARDLAANLSRAFGGASALRLELRNQYIDPDALAPELKEAFKPYFPP